MKGKIEARANHGRLPWPAHFGHRSSMFITATHRLAQPMPEDRSREMNPIIGIRHSAFGIRQSAIGIRQQPCPVHFWDSSLSAAAPD
jgi:hypothetical protein